MCEFPASLLLKQSRQAADIADASDDPAKITYAAGFIKAVQDLRLYHEDLTGCTCWYDAVRQLDAEQSRTEAS